MAMHEHAEAYQHASPNLWEDETPLEPTGHDDPPLVPSGQVDQFGDTNGLKFS